MNWKNIFSTPEEPKRRKAVYESSFVDEYLKQNPASEETKEKYRGAIAKFVDWYKGKGIEIPTQEDIITYIEDYRDISTSAAARTVLSINRNFCKWLVDTGKLNENPWDLDTNKLKISTKYDVPRRGKYKGMSYDEKRALQTGKVKTEEPEEKRFSLSDVAELLLAIEDGDYEAIERILK